MNSLKMPLRSLLTVLALLISVGSVRTAFADEACGGYVAPEALAELEAASASEAGDGKMDEANATLYRVPVYLHVVRLAPGGEGDMPVERARGLTIDVLNDVFADQNIPFQFELAKIDYITTTAETYNLEQNSDRERKLYDLANVSGTRNLNIYIVGPRAGTTVTGWAEFLVNPALKRGDHVVLRYFPQKGGFSDPMVPVHEVGHWLGLLHTFHFGCGKLKHGDLIYDTPTQASGHGSCAETSDTCTSDDGVDPVENIMGYSRECRGLFSPGQIKRMRFLWKTLRGGKGDDLATNLDETAAPATPESNAGCNAGPVPVGGSPLWLGILLTLGIARLRRAML